MKPMEIKDYYFIVYLLGWAVVSAGVFMALAAGFSGKSANTGIGVIFGGLYATAFVSNSYLKLKVTMLEKELEEK